MAVPKRKMSRSNTRSRRSQWKTQLPTLAPCSVCREPKLPHTVCENCGTHHGKQVIDV